MSTELRFGNYRATRPLGQGGMGTVYEAVHVQLGGRAAVKVLKPDVAQDQGAATRFVNEARAASIIEHPGVVRLFEFGQLPDGSAFLVMELLNGETLLSRLRARGGRLGEAAPRIARQIASALCAAHLRGVVHRDLKPANIMLVPDPDMPGGERVKVLDFGLAKVNSGAPGELQTATGLVMGTPVYMSPEQCRGGAVVDGQADVYSLGAMLYQMIAGRPPFVGAGNGEVLAMHIYAQPTPLQALEPSAAPALAQLVHQMLAKHPAERPTMAQVAAALLPLEGSGPATLSTPTRAISILQLETPPSTLKGESRTRRVRPPLRTSQLVGFALGALLVPVLSVTLLRALWVQRPVQPRVESLGGVAAVAPRKDPPAPRSVRWDLTTAPAGALVVRAADQAVLGRTPWHSERPAAPGTSTLVLRRPGYAEQRLVLRNHEDERREETLRPLARGPRKAAGPPTVRDDRDVQVVD